MSDLPPIVAQPPVKIKLQIKEIINANLNLNAKKAPGFDDVSTKMFIELPHIEKIIILCIFNAILCLEYYPSAWKVGLVKMILNTEKNPSKVESYRPISLLPTMSKLFEKLLINKLTPILDRNNCIPNRQFDFRRQYSTIEQTHRLM